MTEETEPPWKAALRKSIHGGAVCADGCDSCTESHMNAILAAVLPHMESAFKAGRTKTTARAGRKYVERNLTLTRKLSNARSILSGWRDSDQMTVEILGDLEQLLAGEGDDPAAAAAEMRARVDEVERRYIFDTAELKKRIAELEEDSATLAALEAHGVDNWEGYDDALSGEDPW